MSPMIDLSRTSNKPATAEEEFLRTHYETEVIHLQNHDYFYSLMDRLNQRDAVGNCSRNILLVWPLRGPILNTPAEFGKLRGWGARHDYQIGVLIPGHPVLLKMAKEQGLPAFRTFQEAAAEDWENERHPLPIEDPAERSRRLAMLKEDVEAAEKPQPPLGIRLLFFLLALVSLCAAFYAALPQAKVVITPYLTRKSINMTIWTDDRLDAPTMGGGIPTIEKKFELTLQAEVPATGSIRIESGLAVGEVIIRNSCDRSSPSSAGAVLSTAEDVETGIRFVTLDAVTLAPGEEQTVRIEAAEGGEEGNLPAGSIKYAEYPKSNCWEVRQEKPTSGGNDGIYAAPTDQDRQNAKQQINDQIPDAVMEALENDPDAQDLMQLGNVVVTSVKQEQMQPEPGFASDTLTLRETLEVSLKAVRRSDMDAIIRGQSARLNARSAGLTGYEILSGPREENGLSTWAIRADYLVYEPETNEEALQIMLRGKTLPQARSILNTLEHVKESSITLLPSWMKHMPLAAQNIHVTIYPAAEVEP